MREHSPTDAVASSAQADYAEESACIISVSMYDHVECGSVIERARAAGAWTEALVVMRADDGSYRLTPKPQIRSADTFIPQAGSELLSEFDARMNGIVKPLVRRFWGVELMAHSTTHIVRYKPGDYYRLHTDEVLSGPYRYFSVCCYLNENFEGGQTSFPALDFSFAPRSGKAIIFPSTYPHRAEPVTGGEKYVLVSWLTGIAPIRWI